MIKMRTMLEVADNSGARRISCILPIGGAVGHRAGGTFDPEGPVARTVLTRLGRTGWRRVPPVAAEALAPGECVLVETRSVAVSAREIRERLAAGESARYQVPLAVAEYIADHRLYREPA